jgi:hypothetical protein
LTILMMGVLVTPAGDCDPGGTGGERCSRGEECSSTEQHWMLHDSTYSFVRHRDGGHTDHVRSAGRFRYNARQADSRADAQGTAF